MTKHPNKTSQIVDVVCGWWLSRRKWCRHVLRLCLGNRVKVFCPKLKWGNSSVPNGIFVCHQPVFCSLHGSCPEISIKFLTVVVLITCLRKSCRKYIWVWKHLCEWHKMRKDKVIIVVIFVLFEDMSYLGICGAW